MGSIHNTASAAALAFTDTGTVRRLARQGNDAPDSKQTTMPATGSERRALIRTTNLRLLRIRDVMLICGLSRSSIYLAIKDGTFPRPVAIGGRARAWVQHEVEDWVGQRVRASRHATS
jgi:prophage regulatory protein